MKFSHTNILERGWYGLHRILQENFAAWRTPRGKGTLRYQRQQLVSRFYARILCLFSLPRLMTGKSLVQGELKHFNFITDFIFLTLGIQEVVLCVFIYFI